MQLGIGTQFIHFQPLYSEHIPMKPYYFKAHVNKANVSLSFASCLWVLFTCCCPIPDLPETRVPEGNLPNPIPGSRQAWFRFVFLGSGLNFVMAPLCFTPITIIYILNSLWVIEKWRTSRKIRWMEWIQIYLKVTEIFFWDLDGSELVYKLTVWKAWVWSPAPPGFPKTTRSSS